MTTTRPKVRWSPVLQAWIVRRPNNLIGSMHPTLAEAEAERKRLEGDDDGARIHAGD